MGINTHYYTVYGVKIDGYPEDFSEAYDEKYDEVQNHPDFDVIADGMGGSYIIIGKVLFDSGDLRYNDIEDAYVEIDTTWLKSYKVKSKKAFLEMFPEYEDYMNLEWKLMTFVHYS